MDSGEFSDTTKSVSSRRTRKRESDRRCQRMARERTKARIAHLETLVDSLKQQDSSGQVANLMEQLSQMEKERDAFSKILKDVQKILRSDPSAEPPPSPHQLPPPEEQSCNHHQPPTATNQDAANDETSSYSYKLAAASQVRYEPCRAPTLVTPPWLPTPQSPGGFGQDLSKEVKDTPSLDLPTEKSTVFKDAGVTYEGDPIVPQLGVDCECTPRQPEKHNSDRNLWRFANETLIQRFKLTRPNVDLEEIVNEDIPIRAMMEGWDAVESRTGLSPVWKILRRIDQIMFSELPLLERFAIMRIMHILLLFHLDPTPERYLNLPDWYQKRPSQTLLHSYAIDFFPWPGLRERFVFHQHRYCSNKFWKLFVSSFRFRWPFEFRDCYVHNLETGMYQCSPIFSGRIFDINSWTMGPGFFNQWPELTSDIPAFSSIPRSIGFIVDQSPPTRRAQQCYAQDKELDRSAGEVNTAQLQNTLSLPFPMAENTVQYLDVAVTPYLPEFATVRNLPSWTSVTNIKYA